MNCLLSKSIQKHTLKPIVNRPFDHCSVSVLSYMCLNRLFKTVVDKTAASWRYKNVNISEFEKAKIHLYFPIECMLFPLHFTCLFPSRIHFYKVVFIIYLWLNVIITYFYYLIQFSKSFPLNLKSIKNFFTPKLMTEYFDLSIIINFQMGFDFIHPTKHSFRYERCTLHGFESNTVTKNIVLNNNKSSSLT